MATKRFNWLWLPTAIIVIIAVPLIIFFPQRETTAAEPSSYLPVRKAHVDHGPLITGTFSKPQDVTARCLECHPKAEHEILRSSHWTWEHEAVQVPGRENPVKGGKKHLINNFCIGIGGNWEGCTGCHAGYGWKDSNFDFNDGSNIDCLVCHEQSGTYVKGKSGQPVAGVDLVAAAKSVAHPTRKNCGSCHFDGGGGDAVKHGDLDSSLYFPSDDVDVHMGKYNMQCTDCHQTEKHVIGGRALSVSLDAKNQIACTDCHSKNLHEDSRINQHTTTVACQTCHIPEVATRGTTKTHWDWSQAGNNARQEDKHYKKMKGEFQFAQDLVPTYLWYSGTAQRYLYGDKIAEQGATDLNLPHGAIGNVNAVIFPFKVHIAQQIYDRQYRHLLQPKTYGEQGYWSTFDWDSAVRQGSELTGLAYSGSYDFTETRMYWPQTHMVQPASQALQCHDCHNENSSDKTGRLDWKALGYSGDPIRWGSRPTEAAP